ncbi:hypothetical protein MUK70_15395 [Dyadobacter chenwenxiniae]|uniref:Ankyrin repeat-containing protein n=1 Tax=Dyadobacter chenwenxiniae TaxID=2906456 RepID=A0A9X1TJY5_9BACT|nr:ankyrin repeat domain-containing protein [Dyadobacter chenwenxiniae]MCF0060628.1 hypothetical protein [Dyadobacter chenwenxiniae]UON80460.1 hypothetical protein MUK70_15395 [Dyadobacter chenwenxiniae]
MTQNSDLFRGEDCKIAEAVCNEDLNYLESHLNESNINHLNEGGLTFINLAYLKNKKKSFKWLINHSADPNVPIYQNGSYLTFLLNLAIKDDSNFYYQLLIGKGDFELKDYKGLSPVHNALRVSQFERALELIDAGANINVVDSHHQTPVFYLCQIGNYELAYKFLQRGADIDIPDDGGIKIAFMISNDQLPIKSKAYFWQQKILEEFIYH